nr:hypothetical protein [uncultured Flavobacterium sp.]
MRVRSRGCYNQSVNDLGVFMGRKPKAELEKKRSGRIVYQMSEGEQNFSNQLNERLNKVVSNFVDLDSQFKIRFRYFNYVYLGYVNTTESLKNRLMTRSFSSEYYLIQIPKRLFYDLKFLCNFEKIEIEHFSEVNDIEIYYVYLKDSNVNSSKIISAN